jgi:hypothetical protein
MSMSKSRGGGCGKKMAVFGCIWPRSGRFFGPTTFQKRQNQWLTFQKREKIGGSPSKNVKKLVVNLPKT